MKKKKFNPGIRISIFFVFFAILFFSLGLWQIERGNNKATILKEFDNNLNRQPSYLSSESKKWDRVYVEGIWMNSKQVYIDNVINRGIVGYKVITPLEIKDSNELLLVDRGWIKQNDYRDDLPNINIENENVLVSGILEIPELGLVLSDDIVTSSWPKVSQTKNLEILTKEYEMEIYPMILVADPVLKNSLEYIKIIPTNMMPVKHYGYSGQWFLMFFVLCLMYVWYGFKRNA
tara:strand:+ start:1704 stop:2402 length:699 start_codon:yes stop_codon:yes gene_type:complete